MLQNSVEFKHTVNSYGIVLYHHHLQWWVRVWNQIPWWLWWFVSTLYLSESIYCQLTCETAHQN